MPTRLLTLTPEEEEALRYALQRAAGELAAFEATKDARIGPNHWTPALARTAAESVTYAIRILGRGV